MSFIRRTTGNRSGRRRKVAPKKKPDWDSTIQDLTVHKATPEEMEYRKKSHQSKNHMKTKLDKIKKDQGVGATPTSSLSSAQQLAIMKEVLYDQTQLQSVLSQTDQMLATVKDLFGDDPRRFQGFPSVTSAPGSKKASGRSGLIAPNPDILTRTDSLSHSVMKPSALNDGTLSTDSEDSETEVRAPVVYEPKMDVRKFQHFLEQEEHSQSLSTISGHAHGSRTESGPAQSTRLQDSATLPIPAGSQGFETPKKNPDESISILRTPGSAINDTKKVKKTKKRIPDENQGTSSSGTFNMSDLRQVLENLEREIDDFERQTGRRPPAERQRSDTFSGYTVALVDAVTKMMHYLRETELQLQAETTVREQLTQDVHQLSTIVNALTSDIIINEEEFSRLQSEYRRYRQDTQEEIIQVKSMLIMINQQLMQDKDAAGGGSSALPQVPNSLNPEMGELPATAGQVAGGPLSAVPDYLQSESSAIMLSPPVRKTRISDKPAPQPSSLPAGRQTSLIDLNALVGEPSHQPPSAVPSESSQPLPLMGPSRPQDSSRQQASVPRGVAAPQSHPVATVSVPRPMPLVQSNLTASAYPRPDRPTYAAGQGQARVQGQGLGEGQAAQHPQPPSMVYPGQEGSDRIPMVAMPDGEVLGGARVPSVAFHPSRQINPPAMIYSGEEENQVVVSRPQRLNDPSQLQQPHDMRQQQKPWQQQQLQMQESLRQQQQMWQQQQQQQQQELRQQQQYQLQQQQQQQQQYQLEQQKQLQQQQQQQQHQLQQQKQLQHQQQQHQLQQHQLQQQQQASVMTLKQPQGMAGAQRLLQASQASHQLQVTSSHPPGPGVGQSPNSTAGTSTSTATAENSSGSEKDQMAEQIAELGRQHEEAQRRLQMLLQRQQSQSLAQPQRGPEGQAVVPERGPAGVRQAQPQKAGGVGKPGGLQQASGAGYHSLPASTKPQSVSPPLSPISQRSDQFCTFPQTSENETRPLSTRGITISIPTMEPDDSGSSPLYPGH